MSKQNRLRIKHESAVFRSLPPHLDGLRILHLSDLHSRHKDVMHLDIWLEVRKLHFDMAVITGDVIVQHPDEICSHIPGIRALCARVPVFFVDGNHEILWYDEIKEAMEDAGAIVLANEESDCHLRKFGSVRVLGVRDYFHLQDQEQGLEDISSLFARKKGQFKIVLSHQPQMFDHVKTYGPLLLLAGHTHGGQVRLPFLPTLYAPGQGLLPEYGDGWYKYEGCRMYISRGIGTTIFPLRTFNPPELAVITLHKD